MSQSDDELIALVGKCTNWQQAGKLQSQLFPTFGNEDVCPTPTISHDLLKKLVDIKSKEDELQYHPGKKSQARQVNGNTRGELVLPIT